MPFADGFSPESALRLATLSGDAAEVKRLIDAGADVNETDWFGRPPLANARSLEVAQALLKAGADIGWHEIDIVEDSTCGKEDVDLIGAIFAATKEEYTPFPEGFAIVQALQDAGAPLEWPEEANITRLYFACSRLQANAVDYLLREGASIQANSLGGTPLHAACGAVQKFPMYGEEPNDHCEWIIRSLVTAGMSPNVRDSFQGTPLHDAVMADYHFAQASVVRTLLEVGAEVDPCDEEGQTPLYCAARSGSIDCVERLIAAGANPDLADKTGDTPRAAAERSEQAWRSEAARVDYAGLNEADEYRARSKANYALERAERMRAAFAGSAKAD